MKRILFLNPIGYDPTTDERVYDYISKYKREDTILTVESLGKGLPRTLTYRYYEAIIARPMLERIKAAEKDGYDACVLGSYTDPFLETAKEICEHMVVTGPSEAGMNIAATLGDSFSVIAVDRKAVPEIREYVLKHGFGRFLASIRSLDIPVLDLQDDFDKTERRMEEEIEKAIKEDLAEVILAGCTARIRSFAALHEKYMVPIIDANIAPLKYAEFLCDIRDCGAGWYTSKIGRYSTPDFRALKRWGIE